MVTAHIESVDTDFPVKLVQLVSYKRTLQGVRKG